MPNFKNVIYLKLLDEAFLVSLFNNQLDLADLFNTAYQSPDIELKEIALKGTPKLGFKKPVRETVHINGTQEKMLPQREHSQLRFKKMKAGRLAWIDAQATIEVTVKIYHSGSPLKQIISNQELEERVKASASLEELGQKLAELYPQSIVEAFLKELDIHSLDDFKKQGNLFLKFIFEKQAPYDPEDEKNIRTYPLTLCFRIESELDLDEALQEAKLCRQILLHEQEYRAALKDAEIRLPYLFVAIFPDSAVVDESISGFTAEAAKSKIKELFRREDMWAVFL